MNDQDITDLFDLMERTDWEKTKKRVLAAHRRDRAGTTNLDGFPAGGGIGGGGGPTVLVKDTETPDGERISCTGVEKAALEAPADDEVHKLVTSMLDMLQQMGSSRNAVVNILGRVEKLGRVEPHHGHTVTECCEEACHDPKAKGKRGRCTPCHKWIVRWEKDHPGEQAPPVPTHVIEERAIGRKHIRVKGRLIGPR